MAIPQHEATSDVTTLSAAVIVPMLRFDSAPILTVGISCAAASLANRKGIEARIVTNRRNDMRSPAVPSTLPKIDGT